VNSNSSIILTVKKKASFKGEEITYSDAIIRSTDGKIPPNKSAVEIMKEKKNGWKNLRGKKAIRDLELSTSAYSC